jgi:hypothetical protein
VIKTALVAYLARAKRLPCPDVNLDGREDRAGSPCTSYVGTVPYLDIGLDRATVLDGWDNYIKFVVSPPTAVPVPSAPPSGSPNWSTAWLMKYANPVTNPANETATSNQAFWPSVSTGGVVVKDVAGNPTATAVATPPTGAVVVLISHGKNGLGAVNIKGVQNDSTGVGADESRNINPLVAANQLEVVDREISDQNPPFDDLVMVIRREDLIAPLTANGVLKATADVALAQANDVIIGTTISSRASAATCTYGYMLPNSYVSNGLPAEWGVSYTRLFFTQVRCDTPPGDAYTLTAGDGTTRSVTIGELQGLLARASGFN